MSPEIMIPALAAPVADAPPPTRHTHTTPFVPRSDGTPTEPPPRFILYPPYTPSYCRRLNGHHRLVVAYGGAR
ncbi:hypothetical protein HanXRQr2_Chr03g0135721 [Helianthus annuus]|uniref:Uncharacterized protein n=1 Tax=Helianthus annuus TaxID=4232 RepID=A0A251VE33_HELAN|nr:hypothetical protein HanXRQr2_Chr03g0135721 [Helianthus annuus]KAJ0603114.1 hypothetical protein HanIR_Chr03g0146991 [Helianthus annuus]KAJ0729550.1 hypothetical protein HanLR1_Chr07g0254171 [Helianthus annuus]KAJ0905914.1 hypothetical protein HanPSC8_Chr07g0299511 [Helianthus annuus]KAJ0945814.1 hypothetical protein HanPSC8_Chr03g0132271 [Helianthus annuus]